MPTADLHDLVQAGQQIYETRLRMQLERTHPNAFVAIEPKSGDYFLGQTLSEAMNAAREKYPGRQAFAARVGHRATVEIGGVSR